MQTNPSNQAISTIEQVPMMPIQQNQQIITNEGVSTSQEQVPINQTVTVVRPDSDVSQQDPNKYFRSKLQSPDQSCCFGIKCCDCCQLWVGAHIWILYFLIVYVVNLIICIGILIVLMDEYNTHTLPHEQCSLYLHPDEDTSVEDICDQRKQYEDNGISIAVVIAEIAVMLIGIIINIFTCYGLYSNTQCAFITELCWIGVTMVFVIIYMIMTGVFANIIQLILDACAFYVFYMVWRWSIKSGQVVAN